MTKYFIEATLRLTYVCEVPDDPELEDVRTAAEQHLKKHLKFVSDSANGGVHVEQFILGNTEPLP